MLKRRNETAIGSVAIRQEGVVVVMTYGEHPNIGSVQTAYGTAQNSRPPRFVRRRSGAWHADHCRSG